MSTTPPSVPVPTGEIGTSGLRHYSGLMQEEFEPKLRGRRAMETYREMRDNSAILGASFQAIELTIRKVKWCIEPWTPPARPGPYQRAVKNAAAGGPGEDPLADKIAEAKQAAQETIPFLEECLHDMSFSWADTVLEHLTMVQYGFAPCEIVYKRREGYQDSGSSSSSYDDGRIGWAKVALRGQETITRWDIDPNGGIQGFWQQVAPDFRERYIPIAKAGLFRVSRERNNPEGRSPLRSAYWDYYGAKRLTESMLIGAERDLAGFPVVRIPAKLMAATANAEEKAVFEAYKTIARDTRRGDQEGIVMPSDRGEGGQAYHYDMQLLSSGGKREFQIAELVRDRTRMIAVVLLTDMLLMGHEKVGSYALAEAKGSLFGAALDGYLQAIADVYNQHLIPRLLRLNGWKPAPAPILKHEPLTPENLAALADFLQKMVASKIVTPDRELEDDIRRRADLTPRPDDVEPASETKPEPSAPPPPPADGAPQPPEEPGGTGGGGAIPPSLPKNGLEKGQVCMPEATEEDRRPVVALAAERLTDGRPPLRVSEVAAAIGYTPRYVQKLLRSKTVASVKMRNSRERRIPVAEVRRLKLELRS